MNSTQSNICIISANLGRWFGLELPREVVQAARQFLTDDLAAQKLRGAWVRAFGEDLHLHLSTFNGDFQASKDVSHEVTELALTAVSKALARGIELKLALTGHSKEPVSFSSEPPAELLDLHELEFPYSERDSEPIFVAKALNASWGFFNRALFNLYFNPDKGSGHRIEGNDFVAVVESVRDLRSGTGDVRAYEFGPAEGNELLSLVTDPDDWRLSEVYAVKGRFGEGRYQNEPAARVGGGRNPVFVGRSQSGLPAIGEFTQAVGEFYFGPGAPDGGYRVGLVPVTFAEAHSPASPEGVAKVVAYAY